MVHDLPPGWGEGFERLARALGSDAATSASSGGKVQAGSHSLEGQSAEADGRHFDGYPIWTSKRYEPTAASAMKSQPGTIGRVDNLGPQAD